MKPDGMQCKQYSELIDGLSGLKVELEYDLCNILFLRFQVQLMYVHTY